MDEWACLKRSRTFLGSTAYVSEGNGPQGALMSGDGVLSAQASSNPDWHDAHRVHLRYCDGSSFSGNVPDPITVDGSKLFFRGKQVLLSILRYHLSF